MSSLSSVRTSLIPPVLLLLLAIIVLLYTEYPFIYTRDLREVIKPVHGKSVYLLEDGVKHFIPDWSTFVSLGYDISSIRYMDDAEVNALPEGSEVKQIVEEKIDKHPFGGCPCITDDTYQASLQVTKNMRPHMICFDENEESIKLYKQHYFLHHNNISHKLITFNETVESSYEECDVIMRIHNDVPTTKHLCPEQCGPKPIVDVSLSWLTFPHKHNLTEMVTCSMTFAELQKETRVHASEAEHLQQQQEDSAASMRNLQSSSLHAGADMGGHHKHKAFGSVTSILKAIAKRRIEECFENHLWTSGSVHMASNYRIVHKRKVHGLIIWVGSNSRRELVESQLDVLRNQSTDPNLHIAGWVATEDQYPCRVGSTLCETLSPALSYYHFMPTSRLNVAAAGWACAQRRSLRAMAHTLLLYDPEYLLVVDDDTYVSIDMLKPYGKLDNYIRAHLVDEISVLGQLTKGKKITRRGFYYGGGGYLFGRKTIARLNSFELFGPTVRGSQTVLESQMGGLSLLHEVLPLAKDHCPTCVVPREGSVLEDAYRSLNFEADTSIRIIELCVNMMSQEHTCYHSDHAISRCLVHGVNAEPFSIECGDTRVGKGGDNEASLGMCMGVEPCLTDVHLTCHRWFPHPADYRVPLNLYQPGVWAGAHPQKPGEPKSIEMLLNSKEANMGKDEEGERRLGNS
jgi:hypothetical protein